MPKSRLLAVAVFVLLAVMVCFNKYSDYDLWWHLRLGKDIFVNRSLPGTDSYSYTFAGKPQYTGEWLGDLIIFFSFNWGGFFGINLLKTAILLLSLWCLYGAIMSVSRRSEETFPAAILALVVVLYAVRFRLFVRPYLFSMLFMSLFLLIINRYRNTGRHRILYLLPPATVLWANLSVGVGIGIVAIGFLLLNELRNRRNLARVVLVFSAAAAAALINPEATGIYRLLFDLSSDPYSAQVGEYQRLTWDMLFGYGIRYTFGFLLLTASSLVYIIFWRGWRNFFGLALFGFLLVETALQVRMIELFSLAAAPLAASALERLLAGIMRLAKLKTPAINGALAALMVLLIPFTVLRSATYAFGVGVKEGKFPEGAVNFIRRQGLTGRMFNTYGFGGYLIWRLPEHKVFIDGRYRRIYTPEFYAAYNKILKDPAAWRQAEEKYGFDYAVMSYDLISGRFPLYLHTDTNWALVYWDNNSVVYVKRTPQNLPLIERGAYVITRPSFNTLLYLKDYRDPARIEANLAQIDREIAINPQNQEPILSKAYLLYTGTNRRDEAYQELKRAHAMKPDVAIEHGLAALILMEQGKNDQAIAEAKRSLALNPRDRGGRHVIEKLDPKSR